jgi:cellulose biosynthesis protein BcsQ
MAKIIVVGNEKGGSGKTTTAMHLLVYLLQKEKKLEL